MTAPLCVDCRYFRKRFMVEASLGRCLHPNVLKISPVTGKTVRDDSYASVEREAFGECHPAGDLFEPRKR